MFDKLFKPKIDHSDPKVRLNAIKQLGDINQLAQLMHSDADGAVRDQARLKLSQLIKADSKIDSTLALDLYSGSADPNFKHLLLGKITASEDIDKLFQTLEQETDLIDIVLNSSNMSLKKRAADNISSAEGLKQLQQKCNDKNVLQIVRQKQQLIKEQARQTEKAHDVLNQVCETLERLAVVDDQPLLESRLHVLKGHWDDVELHYRETYTERYEKAYQACYQKVADLKQQSALEEFQIAQNQLCQSVCDTLEQQITDTTVESVTSWEKHYSDSKQQWLSISKDFQPEAQINERFHSLKSAAEKLNQVIKSVNEISSQTDEDDQASKTQTFEAHTAIEKQYFAVRRQLKWPYTFDPPAAFSQITQQHDELKLKLKGTQNKHRQLHHEIDKKVTILKSHIRSKNLIKANRLFNYIQNLISEFPESMHESEFAKIQAVSESLNELRGLNKFVTAPKKETLCEAMEALIGSKAGPEDLMSQIKNIQDKWKSLATSDADADDLLWDRFKKASDTAYEPCAEYLKKLEQTKHDNLARRKQLSEKVEQTFEQTDWQHVDWKKIQTDYTANWKKFNAITPIFYSENKPVQQHFEKLMNQFKDKLNQERSENEALYAQLIERAQTLVDGLSEETIDDQINQIKRLQASWKNIGITHFNKSRKQWNKFRKLCDQIFEFQRDKHRLKRDEQTQQASQAYQIIDKIKALKLLPDDALPASQSDYQTLKVEYEQAEQLPEERQEKIDKRFSQVCEEYETHLAGLPGRSRLSNHLLVRQAAKLCVNAEQLSFDASDASQLAAIITDYEAIGSLPDKSSAIFMQRFNQVEKILNKESEHNDQQLLENQEQLSALAIQLEVLFDLDSPESARAARMNYQLEQLKGGIKPAMAVEQKREQLSQAEFEWYSTGAVSPSDRQELEARLDKIIRKAET